jgi:hypothetical protein
MEQNSSRRWPVREQWDVDSNASNDDECGGGFAPAIPKIWHEGGVERNRRQQIAERRHTQRAQWREPSVVTGRPSRQADDECPVRSRTRDRLAAPRQYARRFETADSAHAGGHRDNNHHQQPQQLRRAPRQTPCRSLQRVTASEQRAPMLKREAVPLWPNRARTNWSSRDDWPRSTWQARVQAPWRPNTGRNSFAGDPECEGDVSEWANDEALQSPIESNAQYWPRPRWRENNEVRSEQRHWSKSCTEEPASSVRRHRWVSTTKSEWQSTRSQVAEQDEVVLRPDVVVESRFRNDTNLSDVERQRHDRHRSSVKQESGSRLAAMGLPAWAIAPASSRGPVTNDDTGGGDDESLPVRLSYVQRFVADDDDDESDDEDCDDHELAVGDESLPVRLSNEQRSDADDDDESDNEDYDDHELELETKGKPRVSALGKTKARAKWSPKTSASSGVLAPGSGKRKQAVGQRNNGGAESSKRRKRTLCRFNGGCDKVSKRNGLCIAHGGGKRCRHAGGCGKSAQWPTLYCLAHGGGKRCQHAGGCDNKVRSNGVCIAHGGGKRCQHAGGCERSTRSASSYCMAHGGGKRCQYAGGCDKGAASPASYCVAHGGGERCQHAGGCDKGAQTPTSYCKAHGGGKRCQHAGGCNKYVVRKGLCKQHGMAAGE